MTPLDLIAYRRVHGLSQTDLAKLLARTQRTITRWETGRTPLPANLDQILAALAIEPAAPAKRVVHTFIERLGRTHHYTISFDDGSKLGPRAWKDLPKDLRQNLYGRVGSK